MSYSDAIGPDSQALSLALPFLPFCSPARPVSAKTKLPWWRANHEVSGCLRFLLHFSPGPVMMATCKQAGVEAAKECNSPLWIDPWVA